MFDHSKRDIFDACGISKERGDKIKDDLFKIIKSEDNDTISSVVEAVTNLDLPRNETALAAYMVSEMKQKMHMMGAMKDMLGASIEGKIPGMSGLLGLRDPSNNDDDDSDDDDDNKVDLFG